MRQITIGNKIIGKKHPVFIIAEAGVNHNGSLNTAKQLIDAAKSAGADAIKFQTFKASSLVTPYAEVAEYQKDKKKSTNLQYDLLKQLEFDKGAFEELFFYAKKQGIIFLASPFDQESVDLLQDLGVSAFKVASGEITNFPLLKHVALKKKPVILSTGMSTLAEIGDALKVFQNAGLDDIVLLHCITSYPAAFESSNLKFINSLKKFHYPVGYSDHTLGVLAPVVAVALGAVVIEKHLTLDHTLPGPDHKASLNPTEFKEMVCSIRMVEKALQGNKNRTPEEEKNKILVRKSIVAKMLIPEGTIISEAMLDFKRPGTGIAPSLLTAVIGKKAKVTIQTNELLTFEKLM